jgi:stage II sporulation protein D
VTSPEGTVILESSQPSALSVTAYESSLQLSVEPGGTTGAVEGGVIVAAKSGSELVFEGARYDGEIHVTAGVGSMTMVNVLPVERYLEGVLPHEIGNPGPDGFDAVKSQAVAARTYALQKMESHRKEPFDVHATVLDQVYRGREGVTKVAASAVRDTRGRIIEYNGKPIRAYYSACCGGHTSDIRRVWPDREPADYLHGVWDRGGQEAPSYCREYKSFRWRYDFTGRQIGNILRKTIAKELVLAEEEVGAFKDIRMGEVSPSGRVMDLTIETTTNTFVFRGDRIRWILQPDPSAKRILPSIMFRMDKVMERDRVSFVSISGGGNGHGVGMCQNGAIGMAKKGYTYEMILEHYYPSCTVSKLY